MARKITNTDRSRIFKMAWAAVRNQGITISRALRWAWKKIKAQLDMISIADKIVRETEKAVAIAAVAIDAYGRSDLETQIWVPKSMIQDGAAPAWFIRKKADEAKQRMRAAWIAI